MVTSMFSIFQARKICDSVMIHSMFGIWFSGANAFSFCRGWRGKQSGSHFLSQWLIWKKRVNAQEKRGKKSKKLHDAEGVVDWGCRVGGCLIKVCLHVGYRLKRPRILKSQREPLCLFFVHCVLGAGFGWGCG